MLHADEGPGAGHRGADRHLDGHLLVGRPLGVDVVVLGQRLQDLGAGRAGVGGGEAHAGLPGAAGDRLVAGQDLELGSVGLGACRGSGHVGGGHASSFGRELRRRVPGAPGAVAGHALEHERGRPRRGDDDGSVGVVAGVERPADREVGDVDDGLAGLRHEVGDAVEVALLPRAEVVVVAAGRSARGPRRRCWARRARRARRRRRRRGSARRPRRRAGRRRRRPWRPCRTGCGGSRTAAGSRPARRAAPPAGRAASGPGAPPRRRRARRRRRRW